MKTSILICATCFIVTGCSAQLRFPSLSSALSSLTGFGGSSSGSSGASGSSSSSNSQAGQSSPYSGLVRDYGRNLMMAMSSIYPTLFKPPQPQQSQPQSQPASQSPYDQAYSASQYGSQSLFPSQSAPSFSFGGSTFSISPSLPFGGLSGGGSQVQAPSGSHSPFSASFGSSINSPSSFGPLSSAPFLQQSMPSFAPASSYNAAFEAANGGPSVGGPSSFSGLSPSSSGGIHSAGSSLSNQALISQSSNTNPISSYSSIPNYSGQQESSPSLVGQQQHQPQQAPINQQSNQLAAHSSGPFGGQQHNQPGNQFASQQYRPDMMSIASAPVPSSNSYSNYGNIPSNPSSQQAPASPSSYQQPSYR